MSSLFQQLNQIKTTQKTAYIGPPPTQQPFYLLQQQQHTIAPNIDVLYTMAILSFEKLKSFIPASTTLKDLSQKIFSQSNKGKSRNLLTKQQNSALSLSLRKFMLYLSPFLKDQDGKKVMEYILKNYHCQIFEAETLLIAFMHYWKDSIYTKICKLVFEKAKVVPQSLSFLKELIKTKHTTSQSKVKGKKVPTSVDGISSSFMIKSILYSQSVLEQLMLYTSESIKIQNYRDHPQDIQINLEDPQALNNFKEDLQPIRLQSKGFLLQIFQYILTNALEIHYKHIIRFCLESTSTKKYNNPEILSMSMILISQIVLLKIASIGTVDNLLRRLYKAIMQGDYEQNKDEILQKYYKLVLIVWQREPEAINLKLIEYLLQDESFQTFISKINCSLFMVFRKIFNMYCLLLDNSQIENNLNFQGALALLDSIVLKIKQEPFVEQYYKEYFNDIFCTFSQVRNTEQENYIQLKNFVVQYLQFELAEYFNRNINQNNLKIAKYIFGEKRVNENGVNLAILIRKVKPQQKMEEEIEQPQPDISDQQQSKQDIPKHSNHKTIIQLLSEMEISPKNGIINYKDQNTKAALLKLINEYYEIMGDTYQQSDATITQRQKNILLQNQQLMNCYTHDMFLRDLSLEDWSIPIKYFLRALSSKDKLDCKKWVEDALSIAVYKNYILSNVMYRELVRVCLDILSHDCTNSKNYKITIKILNKLYSQMYQSALSNKSFIIEINDFCLKISRTILNAQPKNMGKYYKLLNIHCKLLGVIIKVHLHIDTQSSSYEYPLIHYEDVQRCYREIISIFTSKEIYLINVGLLQILSKNNIESKALLFLIKLIMGSVNNGQYSIPQLIESISKMLTFCQLLGQQTVKKQIKIQKTEESNVMMSIGRKVSKNFYGNITDKHRKFIIKKIIYFLSIFYRDQKFITVFNNFLEKQKQATQHMKKKKNTAIQLHSYIYEQILKLDQLISNSKGNLELLKGITNIFPLQSRISLFIPLLPNNTLYRILSEQLAQHPHFDSTQLTKAVNILPDCDGINYNWLTFTHQCFLRGHKIDEQYIRSIIALRTQKLEKEQVEININMDEIICKFICFVAQHCREALLPVLQESLQIIHKLCIEYFSMQTQQGYDSLLAISGRCIQALEDIIGNKIIDIFGMAIEIPKSQYLNKYFELICQHLSKPIILQLIKLTYKTVEHFKNYMNFLKIAVKQNFKESIIKILQKLYSRTIKYYLEEQNLGKSNLGEVKALQQLQAQIFVQMALLLKEEQLRKLLINFVSWSQNRENAQLDWPISFRKTIILNIFSALSQTLGSLFTNFYGFIFDGLVLDIKKIWQKLASSQTNVSKNKSRNKSMSEHSLICWKYYLAQSLNCLSKLLQNDTERQFLDVGKFEQLSLILSDLFLANQLAEDYEQFMKSYLKPCLLSLNSYVKDEYQIKTLNFKILLHLKGQNYQRSIAIYDYLHDLVNKIQDRFLIVMEDLGRLLKQAIQSRNSQVQKLAKAIIFKVRQLTGQDLSTYI